MQILNDLLPASPPHGEYAFGTALDAKDDIETNLRLLTEKLGPIAQMRQVHGDTIQYASKPGVYQEADAIFTDHPELWLAVKTADCLPVLITTPYAVAAVHAGWRGLQKNIIGKTLNLMIDEFNLDPTKVFATIGPHIRQHNYEVDDNFTNYFDDKFFRPSKNEGHLMLDLGAVARQQIREAGLTDLSITDCGVDTYSDERFFSYRRLSQKGLPINVQPSLIKRVENITYRS